MHRILPILLVACTHAPIPTAAPNPPSPSASEPASASADAGSAAPTSGTTAPTSAGPAPTLRLPTGVAPLRYRVDLVLRPDAGQFSGRVEIDVDVAEPTGVVWLNAVELDFDEVSFVVAGSVKPAKLLANAPGFVALAAAAPLPRGPATLRLSYRGKAPDDAAIGVFRVKEGKSWYLLSKFESVFARRAFPSFDEPGFKVPFELTLHVPRGLVARSNMPALSETDEDGGMKVVRFPATPPLPTYLFAFCVGPFDILDAGTHGKKHTRIQLLVPAGRRAAAGFAAAAAGALFTRLEEYFGVPYPFDKLDLIAAPQYPGAMENAALPLYAARLLLIEPRASSIAQRRNSALVIAHETAHMWFGDLVTTAWWDDIWLNEGFASWLETKVVGDWQPAWEIAVDDAAQRSDALAADSLTTARQIRQPIATEDDIFNAFDGITYKKGAAVLAMFEAWLGPEVFRQGVRSYLEQRAFGSATSRDFLGALEQAAGKTVGARFSTFLDQPGAPRVAIALDCGAGHPPRLRLRQERWLPVGGAGDSTERRWSFPVCVKHPSGRACAELDGPEAMLELPGACPAWIYGNAGGNGYYHVVYEGELGNRLASALPALDLRERYTLIGDLGAQLLAGRAVPARVLGLLPKLTLDRAPRVVLAAVELAAQVGDRLIDIEQRPAWSRFIGRTFGPLARRLGWAARKGDDEATRSLRGPLLALVAIQGDDAKLTAEGTALARRWLGDKKGLDADVRSSALSVLAESGTALDLVAVRDALRSSRDAEERQVLLRTLGRFHDPNVLRQVLALILSDDLNARDGLQVYLTIARVGNLGVAPEVFAFVREHLDALVPRFPPNYAAELVGAHAALCDPARLPELEALAARAKSVPGGPRALRQAVEELGICAEARAAARPALEALLR